MQATDAPTTKRLVTMQLSQCNLCKLQSDILPCPNVLTVVPDPLNQSELILHTGVNTQQPCVCSVAPIPCVGFHIVHYSFAPQGQAEQCEIHWFSIKNHKKLMYFPTPFWVQKMTES